MKIAGWKTRAPTMVRSKSYPTEAEEARARSIAAAKPARQIGGAGGSKIRQVPASWKNRGVLFEARRQIAGEKSFTNHVTRQQRRLEARRAA